MNLPNDVSRCMGLLPGIDSELPCAKRDSCKRYTERYTGSFHTPFAQWLCPGPDEYYERYIEADE